MSSRLRGSIGDSEYVAARWCHAELVDLDRLAQALQRAPPERAELHRAAPADEIAHQIGSEDLTGSGGVAEPAGEHDRPAEVVTLVADRLSDVQADAHAAVGTGDVVEGPCDRPLDRRRRGNRLDRAREHDHQAVAQRLHGPPAVRGSRVADQAEVRPPVLFGALVADPFHRLGRGHQIGEQDRHDRRLIEFCLSFVGR